MSFKVNNRTVQTATTTGTADFQLIAPDANRLPFDDVTSGEEVPYYAENANGTEYEYGRGVITSGSPDQLTRVTIYASSNAGNKVNFSAGTKTIYLDVPAQLMLWVGASDAWAFTDIASATTTNIGSTSTLGANITGTTTITSLGSHRKTFRLLKFAASLTLTHNGTSLILPGAANRITQVGDVGGFMSDASGNWRELFYHRANTNPGFIANRSGTAQTGLSAANTNKVAFSNVLRNDGGYYDGTTNYRFTPPPGVYRAIVAVTTATGTSNESHSAQIWKNGAVSAESIYFAASMLAGAGNPRMEVVQDIEMNGTDYIEAYVYLPAGVTAISGINHGTFFSAYKIRDL